MHRFALLPICLALAAVPVRAQQVGSYLALRIDQSELPLSDKVTDDDGTEYLVEFERLVLSLRSGNRFRAAVRFKRTVATAGSRSRSVPIQSMTVTGRYEVVGSTIRFLPDSSPEVQSVRMLDGTVDGPQRISVPFDYRNGAVQRKRVLKLQFRGDIL